MNLSDLRFTTTHEWIDPSGKVGISDHAQKEITDVVFIELPTVGKAVAAGGEAGTIESVKAAFPIYAPVAGSVVAVNGALGQDPGLVNRAPYGEGWLYQIAISDPATLNQLMTHEQYQEHLKTASH